MRTQSSLVNSIGQNLALLLRMEKPKFLQPSTSLQVYVDSYTEIQFSLKTNEHKNDLFFWCTCNGSM